MGASGGVIACSLDCVWLLAIAPVVWLSRRLESVGKRGAWLRKQILFWLTCTVEHAVVGMSVSLPEETAVKDPEDDEAFRADDVQMGAAWLDGLGFGLVAEIETSALTKHGRQQSLVPVLLSESRARRCSHGPYCVDAAVVGGLNRMLGVLCCSIWTWLLDSPDGPVWLHLCVAST